MHNLLHIIFVNMSHTAVVSSEVCNLNGTLFLEETAVWKGKDSLSLFYAAIFTQWNVWTGYHKSKSHPSVNTHHILSTEPHILNPSIECCFWCSKWNTRDVKSIAQSNTDTQGQKVQEPSVSIILNLCSSFGLDFSKACNENVTSLLWSPQSHINYIPMLAPFHHYQNSFYTHS